MGNGIVKDNSFTMETAILLIIFNRLDTTKHVFESIKAIQPSKLYIAGDGARTHVANEEEKVKAARDCIVDSVDWECEVKTLFQEENLGCRQAVTAAIDWFFDHEEQGIILEDDCLPDLSFFRFCQELLTYYKDDSRIMCITGKNFQNKTERGYYSYYFSQLAHCWGWASWRRAWRLNRIVIENLDEIMEHPYYWRCFTHNYYANKWRKYWVDEVRAGNVNSWAALWGLAVWVNHGLTVTPNVNLITNIGFTEDATHTTEKGDLSPIREEIQFPLKHPAYMLKDSIADDYTFRTVLNCSPIYKRFFKIIRNRLNGVKKKILNR